MIWVVVSSALVTVAFVATYLATHNTWDAAIAGGLVALVCFAGFFYRITRPPMTPRQRWWISGISLVVVVGTVIHWNVMYTMTNYQYHLLHTIHKVIIHGIAKAMFQDEGRRTYVRYVDQRKRGNPSVGDAFRKVARYDGSDSTRLNTDAWQQMKMYVAAVTDTEVVLVIQDSITVDGENPTFRNYDGRVGMVQDRLRITKMGFVHETEN